MLHYMRLIRKHYCSRVFEKQEVCFPLFNLWRSMSPNYMKNHKVQHFWLKKGDKARFKSYFSWYNHGILLPKLFWPTVRKNWSSDREKLVIRGWRPRICKNFEITRTIYSSKERSEQFLVTECFFNLFPEVPHDII